MKRSKVPGMTQEAAREVRHDRRIRRIRRSGKMGAHLLYQVLRDQQRTTDAGR